MKWIDKSICNSFELCIICRFNNLIILQKFIPEADWDVKMRKNLEIYFDDQLMYLRHCSGQ